MDPEGPLYGALAQGLSLACPITMDSGMQWNSLTGIGADDVESTRHGLEANWRITDSERWMAVLNELVSFDYGAVAAMLAADVRTEGRRRRDLGVLDDATWTQDIVAASAEYDNATARADALIATIPGIRAAEDVLRQARLLAADEEVEAITGYDLARASAMARWGVIAGFGEPWVVERVALLCRDSMLTNHSSWRSYALSFCAGRIVTYPDTWGRQVINSIESVRPILDSRHSPWNNLPFPTTPVLSKD
ncbi:DUF1266 domain-containing protein [Gordonia phthalatica]|uniref:DUF1266 domain-containing protein n=1 Tax=Gordonia phthalatica TaxID=1136941 RepID=UPI000B20E21C|nr:DUF1266 domain-containing protein [Gordonia phthalatica]